MARCEKCGHEQFPPKTPKQVRYYRGPCLDALTEYYNRRSDLPLPVHKSYVHERMLEAFLGLDSKGRLRRSRDLDTKEYAQMSDDIRNFLATKGIYVPSPDDPWEEK